MAYVARLFHFQGRVQGVGFRHNAGRLAAAYPIQGFVRNLSDGCVEIHAEGEDAEIQAFVQAIQARFTGNIQKVEVRDIPAQQPGSFEVRS